MPAKNILGLNDLTQEQTTKLFSLINELRFNPKKFNGTLNGKTIALLNVPEILSLTCQRAITDLGGFPVIKNGNDESTLWTTAVDLVLLSAKACAEGKECCCCKPLVASGNAGVVNVGGPCASPVQVVSDLYTILDSLSTLKDQVITLVGDCCTGLVADFIRGSKMGYKVRCVCPASCAPCAELVKEFGVTVTQDLNEGVKGANVIYTADWAHFREHDAATLEALSHYKISMEHIKLAKPSVLFMNPQPHTPAQQEAEVLTCGRSFVKDQAVNRIATVKAMLLLGLQINVRTSDPKRILCALGGNALLQPGQKGTAELQFDNARTACNQLAQIVERGYQLLVTHGNGPQVGAIFLQNDIAKDKVPDFPLAVCGAESQGFIGYMMAQEMRESLRKLKINDMPVACVVTQTVVSQNDPAFQNPTKPIGRFYSKEEADELAKKGWTMMEDSGRGYRYIVPSPQPLEIVEASSIRSLMEANNIVISCGGGGIPCLKNEDGSLTGTAAVIDKDLCGEVLAKVMCVDHYCILTDVDAVFLDYKKPTERRVSSMTVSEARQYLNAGQFGKGSMGPKVDAACRFAEKTGRASIITSLNKCVDALDGKAGTWILP